MKKIAIAYVRVSTETQEHRGTSLQGQVEEIEQFCRDHDIELRAHFLEVESAKTVQDRTIFKAALHHIHYNGEVNLIICTNLDRFARNTIDNEIIRQALQRKGKRVISVQQRFLTPFHSEHEDEDLIAAIQHTAVDNERERRRIRKRMMAGKARKIAAGGWVGYRPPYGYKAGQTNLEANPEQQRVIRLMGRLWKLQIDGHRRFTPRKIAGYLNGNNRLIDPVTKKRGRIFPPPHMQPTKRVRRRPLGRGKGYWTPRMVYAMLIRHNFHEVASKRRLAA